MMLKKPRLKRLFFILFQAAVANAENSIIHLSLILVNSFYLFLYSVNLKVSCLPGKTTRGLCPNRAKLKLSYYVLFCFFSINVRLLIINFSFLFFLYKIVNIIAIRIVKPLKIFVVISPKAELST